MEKQGLRTALVTGGSRGIGRAIVEALLEENWQVFFCSRSTASTESALAELRERFPDRIAGRSTDVSRQEEVEVLIDWVLSESGRIHCLVNNAGIGVFGPVDQISGDDWRRVIDTNLSGAFYTIRAVAPVMKSQAEGWIFNIASLAGRNPFAGGTAYNASKFGMIGLSDAAMLDLRHHGVRVTAILPGSVDTDFGTDRREREEGWRLEGEDVARTVLDLLRYPGRALPSRVELRPSRPPKK